MDHESEYVELADGVVVVSPSPRPIHGWIIRNTFLALHSHVVPRGLGDVFSDSVGYALPVPSRPDTVRTPDAGTPLVWVVEAWRRTVEVLTSGVAPGRGRVARARRSAAGRCSRSPRRPSPVCSRGCRSADAPRNGQKRATA